MIKQLFTNQPILYPEIIKPLEYVSTTSIRSPIGNRLYVGGFEYTNIAPITLNLTMVANTLYHVYLVISGGALALVQSTNYNSVGPVGYSVWKLVGAFYSNTSSLFDVFVDVNAIYWTQYDISDKITIANKNSLTRGKAVPYTTLDGAWRINLNLYIHINVAELNISLDITGITFINVFQTLALSLLSNTRVGHAYANLSSSTILAAIVTGTDRISWAISGDVELASKPTFVTEPPRSLKDL